MPTHTSTPHRMPINLADPQSGAAPSAYVWRLRSQSCRACNSYHQFAELYTETWYKLAGGGPYASYRPMANQPPLWRLPIRTQRMPLEHLAFCFECSNTETLAGLETPERSKFRIVGLGQTITEVPVRSTASDAAPSSGASRRRGATLDDLAKDLDL